MADGYLESHYAEYEKRKAAWLKRKQSYSYQHRNDSTVKRLNDSTKDEIFTNNLT